MKRAAIATLLMVLMLGVCCATYDPCLRLMAENERLTSRNFSLTRVSWLSGTHGLAVLNNANYRVIANRAITDNIKQIDANSELMKTVCRQGG